MHHKIYFMKSEELFIKIFKGDRDEDMFPCLPKEEMKGSNTNYE